MTVPNGSDAAQGGDGIARRRALTFALDGALQALGVPSHHAVGEQCQSAGGGDQLLGAPPALRRQGLSTDLALQGMDGFAAFEHAV